MYTDENKIKSLRLALISLPESVKEWIGSEQATYLQIEINKRLGLKIEQAKIVNQLSARLLAQDINPREFISELSHELNISYPATKAFVQEMEEKIFRPIENELRRDVGLDIKLIYFDQQTAERKPFDQTSFYSSAPASSIVPNTPLTPPLLSETPEINIKTVELPKTKDLSSWAKISADSKTEKTFKSPLLQPTQQAPKTPMGAGTKIDLQKFQIKNSEIPETPFMIHKEESASQTERPEVPKEKSSLNIVAGESASEKPLPQKPISARLETQGFSQTTAQPQPARTVHYSNFLTPLENPAKRNQQNASAEQITPKIDKNNIIDLRKLKT